MTARGRLATFRGPMGGLRFAGVGKRFGAVEAVHDLGLEVAQGELFAILGPSGCGKTTVLRLAAGFVAPDRGHILFGDRDVTDLAPERRGAAMVFQDYALFPHLDVGENVAFGLRARGVRGRETEERVARALDLVDLRGYGRRDVGNLSGGEQQRVAIARAIVVEPAILLLDEPMSNLDPRLRHETRRDLRDLQRRLRITTLFVTHDQEEALEMADRVAVLAAGRLVQVGTPRELYDRPASAVVATFVGRANLLPAVVRGREGGSVVLEVGPGATVRVPAAALPGAGRGLCLVVRPESLVLGGAGEADVVIGEGRVQSVEFRGPTWEVAVALGDTTSVRAVLLNRAAPPEPGSRVRVSVPGERLVVVGAEGE